MNSLSSHSPAHLAHPSPIRTFTQQFSSTRRGARLARLLAVNQFDAWGWPHRSDTSQTAALLVMGSVRSMVALVAALAVFGFMGMVWNVNTTTLMQQRSPAELLGRVSSAFRTLAVAGAPLGALLGGAVAGAWGENTPALLAAAFFVLSVTALIPARRSDVPVVAPDDGATTGHGNR